MKHSLAGPCPLVVVPQLGQSTGNVCSSISSLINERPSVLVVGEVNQVGLLLRELFQN
jgi:hypothetical protein